MPCNIPLGSFGLPYNDNGSIKYISLNLNQLSSILCHGLSNHHVNAAGGFNAGNGSFNEGAGVAIGANAKVLSTILSAIQIGNGTNEDEGTLNVYSYKLLDALGKIPEDRLPPYKMEISVFDGYIQWRYEGSDTWNQLVSLDEISGTDGTSFKVDEYGILNDAKVTEIANNTLSGRYIFVVDPAGDTRTDQTTPAGINGDMSLHIIVYSSDTNQWYDYGQFTGLAGEDGESVEIVNDGFHIKYKYPSQSTYTNIISVASLKGDKGDKGDTGANGLAPDFRVDSGYIQYSYDGFATPINLVTLSALTGPAGNDGVDGADGTEVELSVLGSTLRWKYVTAATWLPLYDLSLLQGADGRNPEFQANATHLQYRLIGDIDWIDIIALSLLKGDKGDKGDTGDTGEAASEIVSASFSGNDIIFTKSDATAFTLVDAKTILKGDDGEIPTFRIFNKFIQYKFNYEIEWTTIGDLSDYLSKTSNVELEGTGLRLLEINDIGGVQAVETIEYGNILPYPNLQIINDHTLIPANNGATILVDKATQCNITVPAGLFTDPNLSFSVNLIQMGVGFISVIAGAGVTIYSADNDTQSRTRYSVITLIKITNDVYLLGGDLA